jgi:hypothetical protein
MVTFDNPIRMISELKGARMAIIWTMLIVKHRISQNYLETVTGYTDKTVSQALAYLREVYLADHNSAGWQLTTAAAEQLPLVLGLQPESYPALDPGDHGDPLEPGDYPHHPEDLLDDWDRGRNISDPDKSLVVEVVNLNNNDQLTNINKLTTTTDSLNNDGKIPTIEEIQRVLDAAEDLLGHRLMGDPNDYQDIDRLLSWICHAYNRRGTGPGKVSNPAGLVYWAFHKGIDRKPDKKYLDLDRAGQWLPESFMRNSGQWTFEDSEDQ